MDDDDETVRTFAEELAEVEERLLSSRRLHGRAGYNSITDHLGVLQERLSSIVRSSFSNLADGGCGHLSEISERLSMAQLSHSNRIPLDLLRGMDGNSDLQRQRSFRRASTRVSVHNVRRSRIEDAFSMSLPTMSVSVQEQMILEEGPARSEHRQDNQRHQNQQQTGSVERRNSYIFASRSRVQASDEGFEVEIHRMSVITTPQLEEDEESETNEKMSERNSQRSRDSTNNEYSTTLEEEEIPTEPPIFRRSQSFAIPKNMSGVVSLPVNYVFIPDTNSDTKPDTKPASVVYSWGSGGAQSLHDDEEERTIDNAMVGEGTRIGRAGSSAIMSVATNSNHTSCSTVQGKVLTCGNNRQGAVDPGRRDESIIKRPTLLESLEQYFITQVSCGLDHTAARTDNGSVITWGSNREGQLGHRRPFRATDDTAVYCHPKGMVLTGGRRAAAVACGHYFTLVLTTRMSLLACGVDYITGSRDTEDDNRPIGIAIPLPTLEGLPLVAVAAGNHHAVALTANGTAFSWGINAAGCCGRPCPEELHTPAPMYVPETQFSVPANSPAPFPNWATWSKNDDGNGVLSLADDVAVIHAACGSEHTALVTRSGRVLVCGNNDQGQLGLPDKMPVSPVVPLVLDHSDTMTSRDATKIKSTEAGESHTLLLDDNGDVWIMGGGNFTGPQRVLSNKNILTIAAGGGQSIAVAATDDCAKALRRQEFRFFEDDTEIDSKEIAGTLESILEKVCKETENDTLTPEGQELAQRTEELLKYPSVLNGLFLSPAELYQMKTKIVSVGNSKVQQAVATAIEKGIKIALDSIRNSGSRMIYPESVRCLLLYVSFFDREQEDIVFDPSGSCILALCETILGLPFEGYNAFLSWATTAYPRELFVAMLIRPLLIQLNKGLKVDTDDDGVQHMQLSRRAVPLIAAVLRWLYMASERNGGIAKPEDFQSVGIDNIPLEDLFEDLHNMKQTDKSRRASNFFLCANPFLFPTASKRNLLQVESQIEMIKTATNGVAFDNINEEVSFDPFWKVEIEREHLLEQTLDKIKDTKPTELRKKLRIVFKGEEGVDAGGVTREFFQLLSEELFNVGSSGLWTERFGSQITWFNSDCLWDETGFELTGVLVGLALYNSVLLDVNFPLAVYRKLLGLPLGLEDMVDKELQKGFQQLLDYDGDEVEDVFCLTFEVSWMDLGEEHKIELKPGGSNIAVTKNNREEYVRLYVQWLLVDSIQPQWDLFEKGVMRVMEGTYSLNLFRPEELELLVVGTPELDFHALEENTKYEGGYDKDSPVVRNFWKFIKDEADRDSQIKFLKFSTGSSKAPLGGLGSLEFIIQRAGPDSSQLPTSHTCFDTLLLPDYGDNYSKLVDRLSRAILECEGFGLE